MQRLLMTLCSNTRMEYKIISALLKPKTEFRFDQKQYRNLKFFEFFENNVRTRQSTWKNLIFANYWKVGWQTFRGHNRWHLVDKRGDISWTLLVTSRGQNCPRDVTFLGDFSWTFFGWDFVDIFGVTFHGYLSSNKLTRTQPTPNPTQT